LVKVVLERGDIAIATARNPDKLSFDGTTEKNFLAVGLDVTDKSSIDKAFKQAIDKFVRIASASIIIYGGIADDTRNDREESML